MRISDWSSDVCSSHLPCHRDRRAHAQRRPGDGDRPARLGLADPRRPGRRGRDRHRPHLPPRPRLREHRAQAVGAGREDPARRLSMQPAGRPSGIPLRRKLLFGMLALLVLYSGYAWYTGLAFTAGIETQDMAWNGDGRVSTQETLQAWYAVTVRTTKEGARECNDFYWSGQENGEPIRGD